MARSRRISTCWPATRTGLPSIARLPEHLSEDARGVAFIDVDSLSEQLPLIHPPDVELRWLYRDGARRNPESDWVRKDVPELRIISDELWSSAKARQIELVDIYKHSIEGSKRAEERKAAENALNSTRRPRTMLSGLTFCGCCDQPYVRRGQDRFCCTSHLMGTGCTNSHTITRAKLEERVVNGLKNRLMAPEKAAEAMRAFAEETNRLNRERRSSGESNRHALEQTETAIREIVAVIEQGGFHRALLDRLTVLEAKQASIQESLARAPADVPDLHPNTAELYRRKVARLSEALDHPDDRYEAMDAIRQLVTRVVITPGAKRGEVHAVLHGDILAIADWVSQAPRNTQKGNLNAPSLQSFAQVSESVESRACSGDPRLCREKKPWMAGTSPAMTNWLTPFR